MAGHDRPMMIVPEWIEAHCVIPDGDHNGEPFILGDEQLMFVASHYTVKASAQVGQKATAFVYRRSQLVRAQKWGKSPLIAAFVCAEAVGPVLFDGWAEGGEVYRDPWTGWEYEYEPGEPMGRRWETPLIQITATSEDQTENTYDALRPMIDRGPLSAAIPRTGEEFIRLPNNGRIDAVTSKANSRLGQRVTFVSQDETGIWTKANGMVKVARTQRRGLAGMGGRAIETTNAWDPAEDSVAQQTFESKASDVQRDFRRPPDELRFDVKSERHKIFVFNYAGAPWVDVAGVEAECAELMERDPAEAERFYGNRTVQGAGHWLSEAEWKAKEDTSITVRPRTKICVGMDLSNNNDWTGIRAETADLYQFTPQYEVGGELRDCVWDPSKWGGFIPRGEVRAAFDYLASRFQIVRAYVDPAGAAMGATSDDALLDDDSWRTEIADLASRYGRKIVPWECSRITPMHRSLEQFRAAVRGTESKFRHDGDPATMFHIRNAVMVAKTGKRYVLGKPHGADSQKIDLAMSSVLAHEATTDALTADEFTGGGRNYVYF